jgi:hypothetical protein
MPQRSAIRTASCLRILRKHVVNRRLRRRKQRRVIDRAIDEGFYRPNSGASSIVAI